MPAHGYRDYFPDVNGGQFSFTVDKEGLIIYGLGAIKGLGEGPIENIIAVTRRVRWSIYQPLLISVNRIDMSVINKRSVEALIRSGAMDSISADRAVLLASMNEAIKTAEQSGRVQESGVDDMFGDLVPSESDEDVYTNFRHVKPWSEQRRLAGREGNAGALPVGASD